MALVEKANINLTLRCNLALALCGTVFFLVIARLWYLQIIKGDYFRDRSENNRIRTVYIPPPRGLIYDRYGKVLVKNRPSFNVELVSEDSPDPRAALATLAKILSVPPETYLDRLQNQPKRRRFEPKLILKDVNREVVAKVLARSYQMPGVVINVGPAREYLYGEFASHILGYIREITHDQLVDERFNNQSYLYRQGDIVGQYGIESRWELDLQGRRGVQGVIVNANGVRIGESSYEPEISGGSISLTIDFDVQKAADDALKDKRGAIVALDPDTGEILAISSAPGFDPNAFTGELSPTFWRELVTGSERKLNNRAVQGAYPPGSVFKVFMAAAALSEGVVTEDTRVNCPGYFTVGSRVFRCHKKEGHGSVNLHEAIIKSCDVYFYTVGTRLGVDRIHDYAKKFGLGELTGLDLVTETPGLVPSTEWKRRYFKNPEMKKWYPGETPSVSIGQGAVTLTPLQIARGLAALINGGHLKRPRLVMGGETSSGSWSYEPGPNDSQGETGIEPWVVKVVEAGMEGVVSDPGGTGHRAALSKEFNVAVAGKTGTAQAVGADSGLKGKHYEDHAWFAGYAPAEAPEIVVVALLENGGHGGVASAPLVKQVMEAYFRKECQVEPSKCRISALPEEATKKP